MGLVVAGLFLAGCTSYYTPPGRGAPIGQLVEGADPAVAMVMDRQPMATFPTAVAVARVQASGYRSTAAEGWGGGQYCVVTARDVEKPEQIERLRALPGVWGIVPLSRLMLSPGLQSDLQLRQAAGRLHADLLLIYTLDTTFTT